MGFVTAQKGQRTKEEIKEETLILAHEKMRHERLPPATNNNPWRASDIKADCPRYVYYSRNAQVDGIPRVGAGALFGTAVHTMLQVGAPDDREVWDSVWQGTLQSGGLRDTADPRIDWHAQAKPFSLSAFRDAEPEDKVRMLFERYRQLDRPNYLEFMRRWPLAIYRHPPTGRLAQESRITGTINGQEIRTTADVLMTDVYTGEILPVDWKTGRQSSFTQLATYAMVAEQFFGLTEGSIKRGLFILTGSGECHAARGKEPYGYTPDYDNMVVLDDLDNWRDEVEKNVNNLAWRQKNNVWTPVLNPLCYNVCQFRNICPIGSSLAEVRNNRSSDA